MRMSMRWLATFGLVGALTGCSSLHLYDKAADAAATSAKADYDASKVTESVKTARAVHDALDAKEIETFRAALSAERDLQLLSLISDKGPSRQGRPGDGLAARIHGFADARLVELVGVRVDPLGESKAVNDAKDRLLDAEKMEKQARTLLELVQPAFALLPACAEPVRSLAGIDDPDKVLSEAVKLMKNPSPKLLQGPTRSAWVPLIKRVGLACGQLLESRQALAAAMGSAGGQLGVAIKSTADQQATLEKVQKLAAEARAELKAAARALAEVQKAVKEAQAETDLTCDAKAASPSAPASAASAASAGDKAEGASAPAAGKQRLCDALDKLAALKDAGIKVFSEERLAAINAVLAALGGTEPAAAHPELEPGLALLGASSRFAQALSRYQQAGKLPALEPLLIDKQMTTLQLAYAKAAVQLAESRVQHAQAYRDATQLEADLLLRAKAELGSLAAAPSRASMGQLLEDKKLAQARKDDGETARRITYRSLAYVAESYSVGRERQRSAELRLLDTDYRDALIKAEAALASWNVLLSVPLDQLQAYHAGGVTVQEAASLAAQLLQALGVIGVAVNIK